MPARSDAPAEARVDALVSEIAGSFQTVVPGDLDDAIVESCRRVGEALQLDLACVLRNKPGEPSFGVTHGWEPEPASRLADAIAAGGISVASIPWTLANLECGRTVCFSGIEGLPGPADRATFGERLRMSSGAIVPVSAGDGGGRVLTAVAFASARAREWPAAVLEQLRLVAALISQALARKEAQLALEAARRELSALRRRVNAESGERRRELRALKVLPFIVAESPAIRRTLEQVERVAPTPATVLLLGETGVGKEVFAQAIHDLSPRRDRQMIRVSCAAMPAELIESELFGRERGAYTGATRMAGRFEAANHSTLFLDEIGELPAEVQVKLLRVLQERVVERLGSTQPIRVDVRIIAATNRNLEAAVQDRSFREDLFYRLNVFPIAVPALRERLEDIPGLASAFIGEFSRSFGKTISSLSQKALAELQRHPWPGNVRELRNVIERAVILATGSQLTIGPFRPAPRVSDSIMTLTQLQAEHIRSVLETTNWRVRGRAGAAERLGVKPTTLESRMARLGIARPKGHAPGAYAYS